MNDELQDDVETTFFITVDDKSCRLENVLNQISTIYDTLSLFKMNINSIQQQLKVLEKDVKKEMKQIRKQKQRECEEEIIKSNRKPSGFAKPGNVSDELCKFMNCEPGTKLARTKVTQYLFKYIKDNDLTQSYYVLNEKTGKNKKQTKIILDDKLKKMLGFENEIEDDCDEITHFSIQKYMNKHFL